LKQYRIGFVGLSTGKHKFSFEIGPDFFSSFEVAAFEQGKLFLDLELEKSNTMLAFHFRFSGEVSLECDRCLEKYRQGLVFERHLLVKFGEAYAEQSDEILIIPATESHVDVSQFVYEFIHLGLPVRHVHPDTAEGEPGCNQSVLEKLRQYQGKPHSANGEKDSPWDALKGMKFD
jgi:uncharacterized protein